MRIRHAGQTSFAEARLQMRYNKYGIAIEAQQLLRCGRAGYASQPPNTCQSDAFRKRHIWFNSLHIDARPQIDRLPLHPSLD
jgi:hypothetical protein